MTRDYWSFDGMDTLCHSGSDWALEVAAEGGELIVVGVRSMPAAGTAAAKRLPLDDAVADGFRVVRIGEDGGVGEDGKGAFAGCVDLVRVDIPGSATSISAGAFAGCAGLAGVSVAAENPEFRGVDGFVFSRDGAVLALCPADVGGVFRVPDSVRHIGSHAFCNCGGVARVWIPRGVAGIEFDAFAGCGSLEGFAVAADNPAFCDVDGVLFSKDKRTLSMFPAGRGGVYAVPEGVSEIGDFAFSGCGALAGLEIPAGVDCFGAMMSRGCGALASISVAAEHDGWSSAGGMLFSKDGATLEFCPEGMPGVCAIPDGAGSIASHAFHGCARLSGVAIPDSVSAIGGYAFAGCAGLAGARIPRGVASLGENIFHGCGGLRGISVAPENPEFRDIDGVVFSRDGRRLVMFPPGRGGAYEIPAGVESIGESAFYGCEALARVALPGGVADIGGWAFAHCANLAEVEIPDSARSIGDYAFYDCGRLARAALVKGLERIGESAFEGCASLPRAALPEGLAEVGARAFADCASLAEASLPSSLTALGADALAAAHGRLSGIAVAAGNPLFRGIGGVLYSKDGATLLRCPDGMEGAFAVPDGVARIGEKAFSGCGKLTAISLPESLARIGAGAFEHCENLASLRIPAGVADIGAADAFTGCAGLRGISVAPENPAYCDIDGVVFSKDGATLIRFPTGRGGAYEIPRAVTAIGANAFADCAKLDSVPLRAHISAIGEGAFSGCRSLSSADIPGSVKRIADSAFSGCVNLTRLALADGVASIAGHAFFHCDRLPSVDFPDSVETISDLAFEDCKRLLKITLGSAASRVSRSAFCGCDHLREMSVSPKNPNYRVIDGALFSKDGATLLRRPSG